MVGQNFLERLYVVVPVTNATCGLKSETNRVMNEDAKLVREVGAGAIMQEYQRRRSKKDRKYLEEYAVKLHHTEHRN